MKSIIQSTIIVPSILLICMNAFITTCTCFVIPNRITNKSAATTTTTTTTTTTALNGKGNSSKKRFESQNNMLQSIEKKLEHASAVGTETIGTPNDDPLSAFVSSIVKEADKRKGENIRALRVSKVSTLCSFIVFVSGNSKPQNQAISQAVKDCAEDEYDRIILKEGSADSGWILLDYGDVMVHVMTPRSRLFYDLEGKWKHAEEMDLTHILIPNDATAASQDLGGDTGFDDQDDDPFWS